MTEHEVSAGRAEPAFGRRLAGGLRLLHPFPSTMNAVATLVFAALTLGAPPGTRTAALLTGAIFASQAAIGSANDWADRDLDRAMKPGKPLAAGLVAPWCALTMLGAALVIAALCAAQFGLASLLLVAAGTGLGLAYNLWLKRTPASWLPYLLAIPLEPIWVWTALGRFTPRLLWLYPLGATLLLALHLANALADLSGDTAAGSAGWRSAWAGGERRGCSGSRRCCPYCWQARWDSRYPCAGRGGCRRWRSRCSRSWPPFCSSSAGPPERRLPHGLRPADCQHHHSGGRLAGRGSVSKYEVRMTKYAVW